MSLAKAIDKKAKELKKSYIAKLNDKLKEVKRTHAEAVKDQDWHYSGIMRIKMGEIQYMLNIIKKQKI
jgi:mRNA-degrading endonuclease RelE of RelBE toxin-antitoxin system